MRLATRLNRDEAFDAVVGRGPAMRELIAKLRKAADSLSPLLLCGESGSGKRALARLVHELSARAEMPFVRLDCAASSPEFLESELLGVKRGAFAGADCDREGLLQTAHRGTLLLENVSAIGAAFQPKLQEILDAGEYRRVGDRWGRRRVDVRIVATTCTELAQAVAGGHFRRGLYDRLGVISLAVPSLRRRPEDIEALLEHFGEVLTQGRGIEIDVEASEVLRAYPWPGNVRELQNAVECGFVLAGAARITLEDLPVALQTFAARRDGPPRSQTPARKARRDPRRDESHADMERRSIVRALQKTGGDATQVARLLALTRRTLAYRIAKYGLESELAAAQRAAAASELRRMAVVRPAAAKLPAAGMREC